METKFIFITGGVVSGLGKGITAASLGRLLKNRGYKVVNQKMDPYINVDPGTMSPYEHGEVFVTDDGAETDLDLGHYERFTDVNLTANSSITSGKIYKEVIEKERKGDYLGKTVQVIPHVTDAIKEKIYSFEKSNVDIVITEIGGTVGDIESGPMIEAIRQVGQEKESNRCAYIHVTLLPYISGSNELKSKPTQHSVKELQSLGIKADILVERADAKIPDNLKEKIALFCNVKKENVIENTTVDNLYEIPIMLEENGLARAICDKLELKNKKPKNKEWEKMVDNIKKISQSKKTVNIAIVGKYTRLEDSYLSVAESIRHGGFANNVKTNIKYIDCEKISARNIKAILKDINGVIIPGGFGDRGIAGMVLTAKYCRENKIPFLGICLGMQIAVMEFAKNVLKLKDVSSQEFDENCKNPVIHIMDDQIDVNEKGGTMRLGAYPCELKNGSYARKIYGEKLISERHRHRYEYNNKYKEAMEKAGLEVVGTSPDGRLVEMVELKGHPFFIGGQFHPEFKSRPDRPAPLFREFVKKAKEYICK